MSKTRLLAIVTLMVVLIAISAPPVFAEPLTVENFSFELPAQGKIKGWDGEGVAGTPAVDIPGWTSDSTPADSGVETDPKYPPTDGDYTAFMMGSDPSVYNLTSHIIGAGDVYDLVFDARITWQATTILATLYYDDSGSRAVGASQQFTLTDSMVEYSLTFAASSVPASVGKNIGIEFDNNAGGWLGMDNVRLSIPDNPVLIYPVSVENQPWDLTLEWLPPPTFIPPGYNIYLDPNEDEVANRNPLTRINTVLDTDPNYDVTGLTHGETYYWLVEARQDPVTTPPTDPNWIPSQVATFTTLPDTPVITTHPMSQTVPATTDVTFTVEAINATGYQWYADGVLMVGKTSPTLILTGVLKAQEGFYHCEVSNASDTVISDKARLMVQRRVALWTFEDTINSVVVTDEDAFTGSYIDPNDLASAGPQYDDSDPSPQGGKALALTGDTAESEGSDFGEFVEASDPNFFDFYPQGVTASAWVTQVDAGNGWSCIVSKEQRAVSPWIGWVLNASNGPYGGFTIRQATNADTSAPDLTGVNEDLGNNWHLVTGTYDGETVSIYIDGDLKNTATSSVVPDPIPGEPLRIGVETFEGLSPWKGMIDNLEIYNYALSRVDVAVMYTDQVPGAKVCTEDMSDTDMDFNDDCITNLKDFAEFAAKWLECYIVPTCIP